MNKTATIALAVVAAALCVARAGAVETMSTAELAQHCAERERAPQGNDAVFCARYVQGFIDGAVATDERVTLNVSAEYDDEATFTERAARTRIGVRLKQVGPTAYAGFCLGAPVPLADVVDTVAVQLEDALAVRKEPVAREFVYATLVEAYPCQAPEEQD